MYAKGMSQRDIEDTLRDFPKDKNQLCIVHQIRNSCKFVPYKDRKAVCADLKKIYGAVNLENAEFTKEEFREKWEKNILTF